jgi:hypothetical protein
MRFFEGSKLRDPEIKLQSVLSQTHLTTAVLKEIFLKDGNYCRRTSL